MVPYLQIDGLTKSFGDLVLFNQISLGVAEGQRIGLIAKNGSGKTTLLNIIAGKEGYDEGSIVFRRDLCVGYLEQDPHYPEELTVLEACFHHGNTTVQLIKEYERCMETEGNPGMEDLLARMEHEKAWDYERKAKQILSQLKIRDFNQQVKHLSGGQLKRVALANVLITEPDFLILDEPTNHLDISAIEWLENFLSAYRGSFIVISHDRYFLDKVTNRTMELKDRRLFISKGNYSRHLELRSTARELEMRQYLRTKKEIKRIEGIVEQQRRWGQERNFITAASKQKQADRLKATLVEPERDSASIHFHFEAKEVGGNDVLAAKKLAKSFDGKLVFRNVDMLIKKGEKVFLLGDNGCGKTTLLNILAGRIRPTEGSYYLGSHVEEAYYEQTMTSLDPEATVLREVWDRYYTTISHKDICNALAAFLFRGDEIEKQIKLLSGGEAARVQLLKLMLTKANLLLLDEPTNHLDIASREALEAALEGYNGTMLIVTHDRYLVNRLADRILHMTPNGLQEYIGGYDDYIAAVNESRAQADEQKRTQSRNALDYRERKQQQSILNRAKGEAARCEAAVSKAEAELDEINEELAKPYIASDYKKASEKRQQIDELYKKWEAAEERLAELTSADD